MVADVLVIGIAVLNDAVNPFTLWTIVVGAVGPMLAMRKSSTLSYSLAAVLVLAAAVPAAPGGLGLLFSPGLLVLVAGAISRAFVGRH